MVPITRWVDSSGDRARGGMAAAVARRSEVLHQHQSFPVGRCAIPASGNTWHRLLQQKKLPPSLLKFELTEMALRQRRGGTRECLDRLHEMGMQLMLDDFGTGYSSLSNLQLFPFDLVKIDCPFVDRRGVFQANMSMVAAMIQLAGSLDLTPIAEIIEGEAAAASLKAMGCRFGQGYYFSEPIEADAALKTLRSQVAFETAHASSDTMLVSPVQGDGSQTLIMRRLQDPSRRELATSETVIVRPLEEAGLREVIISTTRETARQERALSDTIKVRVIDEDTSSTAMLPIETIEFLRAADDEDDDEEDE